jgi:hypothetical protein
MGHIRRADVLVALIACSLLLAACGPAAPPPAVGDGRTTLGELQNYKDFGDYVVHVNALTTDQLPADVAKSYGIVRSGKRALLNVVVLQKVDNLSDQSVSAQVSVSAANLTGQNKGMTMRQINDQDQIYYIGETAVITREILIFDIDVVPDNTTKTLSVRFKKEFFGS